MTDNSRVLDVEVTREKSEIIDELMEYRNEKVQSDTDFPTSYKTVIFGYGDPVEDAFYNAFANSSIWMTVTPGTGFDNMENKKEVIQSTEDSEVDLRAKVDGILDHAPIVQRGIDALEEAGFDAYANIWEEGDHYESIAEAIDSMEENGATLDIKASDKIESHHTDAYHIVARYYPESEALEPDTVPVSSTHGTEQGAEDINRRMEEALDEFGLLKY